MTIDYSARARALVGTRFRPQGRGPEGLDCVGVVLSTFGIPPEDARRDYDLRGDHLGELRERLDKDFRRISKSRLRAGDVMLMCVGQGQMHLGVRTQDGFVHAHAGLRRVVETPDLPEWRTLGIYRMRRR